MTPDDPATPRRNADPHGGRPRGDGPWVVVAVVVVTVVVAGSVGLILGRLSAPPTATSEAPPTATDADARRLALFAMRGEAERLSVAGRFDEARAAYGVFLAEAAGREGEPGVREAVADARHDLAIVERLIAGRPGADPEIDSSTPAGQATSRPLVGAAADVATGRPALATSPATVPDFSATGPVVTATATAPAPGSRPEPSTRRSLPVPGPLAEVPEPPLRAEPRVRLSPVPASDLVAGDGGVRANAPIAGAIDPAELDARVDDAIRRGADFLLSQFRTTPAAAAGRPPAVLRPDPPVTAGPGGGAASRPAVNPAAAAAQRTELFKAIRTLDPRLYGSYVMAVYALASAGRAVDDPRLTVKGDLLPPLLDKLAGLDLQMTYTRGFRAAALAVNARPADRATLASDAAWLIEMGGADGKYAYGPSTPTYPPALAVASVPGGPASRPAVVRRPTPPPAGRGAVRLATSDFQATPMGVAPWDNSNSQVALLGVWSAAEAGVEVPRDYWARAEAHWRAVQQPDGQWGYSDFTPGGRASMTCAGVSSLTVTHDYLHAPEFVAKFSDVPVPAELVVALKWLDDGQNAVRLGGGANGTSGYDLFAVERAGRATGSKYFGQHDWYRELAGRALAAQRPNGSWPPPAMADPQVNAVTETAFHLLFLARGRQPVLMNKLRFDGRWANRPRDAASGARYVARATERPLGWQAVTADRPGTDLLDAPILYVASADPPPLTDAQLASVRQYVEAGGMVLLHADGGSPAFARWAEAFAAKVCPPYPLRPLPPTHELFNLSFRVGGAARLRAATNGSRLLVVLAEDDLAGAWQSRDDRTRAPAFQLLANLYLCATGKTTPTHRPTAPYPPLVRAAPAATFAVARLQYNGNWDPEPGAWPRFARLFRRETSAALKVDPIAMADLSAKAEQPATRGLPATAPAGGATVVPVVAHLTGTAAATFAADEVAAAGAYVAGGGVLLVDACGGPVCGGQDAFAASVRSGLFPAAFPGMALRYAGPTDPPIVRGQPDVTDDLSRLALRPYAREAKGGKSDKLLVGRYGRGWVVFSPLDLTTGLAGAEAWGVLGYAPYACKGVVKNLLVWAATARGDPPSG